MKTVIPQETLKIMPTLYQFKNEMQNLYHQKLVSLILYGSYARGTAHEFSDIDILLVLTDMAPPPLHRDQSYKYDNKQLSI